MALAHDKPMRDGPRAVNGCLVCALLESEPEGGACSADWHSTRKPARNHTVAACGTVTQFTGCGFCGTRRAKPRRNRIGMNVGNKNKKG